MIRLRSHNCAEHIKTRTNTYLNNVDCKEVMLVVELVFPQLGNTSRKMYSSMNCSDLPEEMQSQNTTETEKNKCQLKIQRNVYLVATIIFDVSENNALALTKACLVTCSDKSTYSISHFAQVNTVQGLCTVHGQNTNVFIMALKLAYMCKENHQWASETS